MAQERDGTPRITVATEMKVNLGNYESAGVSIILSQVPVGATEAEIEEMLDTGRLMFDRMRIRLADKVREARGGLK